MTLNPETFIYQRSKISKSVFLEYYSTKELEKLLTDKKIEIVGKNKNIIKYNYNFKLKSENIELKDNSSPNNFNNFKNKIKNLLLSLKLKKIKCKILTN